MIQLVWFRQDLRIADNPALASAAARGPVLPFYILDETAAGGEGHGAASRWWLHQSLLELRRNLGSLYLLKGDPSALVPALARRVEAGGVFWNRRYEPLAIERDKLIKERLKSSGLLVRSSNSALLFEPWTVRAEENAPFTVFTPFWQSCLRRSITAPLAPLPLRLANLPDAGERLEDWALEPTDPDWASRFKLSWRPGERGAQERLAEFVSTGIEGYRKFRDFPALRNVSRLSPHLHWGEISPRQVWHAVERRVNVKPDLRADADKFLSELGWREFAHYLLFNFPKLPTANWRSEFDAYPWTGDAAHLAAWQRGRTGYPFVDAGMRELWATGYLSNRARLVAASFLVKHLRIHWREGLAWFHDTLLDADLANNCAGWQWVAGSGADAAGYSRIFNPIEQGRKFDPEGEYVRRWCPELARLPGDVIHAPFEASASVQRQAEVELGVTYPYPIVNHAQARQAALDAYAAIKG